MTESDRSLVARCLAGEQRAWDELVERYGRLVYSIANRYRFNDADADDVLQSVFTLLFRRIDQLRDESRLSSWLITTAHRECWRIGRRAGRYPTLVEEIEDVSAPSREDAERWEREQMVRSALHELGGRCEELLTALFYADGRPDYAAIAEQLGMKIGSIGPTRARCFEKLAPILSELGLEPEEV